MHTPKKVLGEFGGEFMKNAKNSLKVRDCMSVDPATVGPKDSLQMIIELLRQRDIRSVPVVEKGKLIGIVTDRDVRQVAPAYPLFRDEDEIRRYTENLTVTAAMSPYVRNVMPRSSSSSGTTGEIWPSKLRMRLASTAIRRYRMRRAPTGYLVSSRT